MAQVTTIELQKQNMKFAAGHFTIFSETEREPLHGHNYNVYCAITTLVEDNGLSFDYRYYKHKLYDLCRMLHQTFLLPTKSRYITIEDEGDYWVVLFNKERIPFLKSDITFVPLTNITVEELSHWFVDKLIEDKETLKKHNVTKILVKVFSGPGQSGSCSFEL